MVTADDKNINSLAAGENSIELSFNALISHLQSYSKDPELIQKECASLQEQIAKSKNKLQPDLISKLMPLYSEQTGLIAISLFNLLEEYVKKSDEPWPLLEEMLSTREQNLILKTLDLIERLAAENRLKIDYSLVKCFAEKFADEKSLLKENRALSKIAEIINRIQIKEKSGKTNPVLDLFFKDKDLNIRSLAASILDLNHKPVSLREIKHILEKETTEYLLPYLEYTRASHQDILYITELGKAATLLIDCIRQCESIAGFNLTRDIIANLRWQKVNYGLSVRHFTSLKIMNSLPFFVYDEEAELFEKSGHVAKVSDYYFFTAHGGMPAGYAKPENSNEPIARFRSYNLTHAEVLKDILDVSPLSPQKAKRIIKLMDKIVDDFIALFSSHTEECKILPEVYNQIKNKILSEIPENMEETQFSPDAARLVQMFEDPPSLGKVHTLHGLKRYLHQRGLQLGFKLVNQSQSPNYSIALVLASGTRILKTISNIKYADFEPQEDSSHTFTKIPYAIKIVCDSFMRQLLYGQENFPIVNIFCYGNEVHYFVWFRNHPIFIRIDYSPPLQGGMIDLEYFGVSNYEVSYHPNLSLDAVRIFFEKMEFDVQIKGTHVHARYDKERTLDLSQLTQKAEYLFCFVAYLMDLDWIIGSLNLNKEAKMKVIHAWADMFLRWGAIPINKLLTADRQNIIEEIKKGPEGETEVIWDGTGDYRDCYSVNISEQVLQEIFSGFEFPEIEIHKISAGDKNLFGQIFLENNFLNPIRTAIKIKALTKNGKGLQLASREMFRRVHEAVRFAEMLNNSPEEIGASIILSQLVQPLEQTIEFHTTGSIQQFKVQTAKLSLKDKNITLYILRDHDDIIRMAIFSKDDFLFMRRCSINENWQYNSLSDSLEFASLLRQNDYSTEGPASIDINLEGEISKIKDEVYTFEKMYENGIILDERIIKGLRASPGRASAKILLGISGRSPRDLVDHILAVPSISPSDNAFIYHSAGIVSTGGGILSHAGLIASQFNKPAVIISGKWGTEQDGTLRLLYSVRHFNIRQQKIGSLHVSIYHNMKDSVYSLAENDLVVLDADKGSLEILGQGRETLSLYDSLKTLGNTLQQLSMTTDDNAQLVLRGKQLKVRHQTEKILSQLSAPVLARYALHEILSGEYFAGRSSIFAEKIWLLTLLLKNIHIGQYVEKLIKQFISELIIKYTSALEKFKSNISAGWNLFDIIKMRLDVIKNYETIINISRSLSSCGINEIEIPIESAELIERICFKRLKELYETKYSNIKKIKYKPDRSSRLKHLLRQVERINLIIWMKQSEEERKELLDIRQKLNKANELRLTHQKEKLIIVSADGGIELFPLIGMKAANLAEIDKLGISEMVPHWFAVSDKAFQTMLSSPIKYQPSDKRVNSNGEHTLIEEINFIISQKELNDKQKSYRIRNLWNEIELPEEISCTVIKSYKMMKEEALKKDDEPFFVAVRSSSCEEDTETAARAGEFDTFLYIQGEEELIKYLRFTWSGLWSERALHNREAYGYKMQQPHGGIIVQQMVNSRVSGVLLTINPAKNDSREIVINAGLGLGEGIVSGIVSADQIVVSKDGDLLNGHFHFNYITADKTEQVVFNKRAGTGTIKTSTLYHQRFRAALEYTEICQLVAAAVNLEAAYGYPLDIEFAFEDSTLYILQVRPVAVFLKVFNETLKRYPLKVKDDKNFEEIKK